MFLKSLTLPELPRSARVSLRCDARYRLYVNGIYLGRGPQRDGDGQALYSSCDITAALKPGPNFIAVLDHAADDAAAPLGHLVLWPEGATQPSVMLLTTRATAAAAAA